MSGGHFDYDQYRLLYLEEEMQEVLNDKDRKLHPLIVKEVKDISEQLKSLYQRIHDLDYFLSADTGEDTYIKKLTSKD